jgi:hypothetical protein
MGIPALLRRLGSPHHRVSSAAHRALVKRGPDAVGPVLAELSDERSPVDWSVTASVLRSIGDAAFDPLVNAIAAAPTAEVARRCGWAFCGLDVSGPEMYLPALRHPHPKVRDRAAYALQLKSDAALPYAPQLIELLADPDKDVRQRALWALTEIGSGVVPLLRELRRSTTAGQLRRHALTALAAVAGPDAFDAGERALIERLIRVKRSGETPEPMHLCGSWYALPTRDQAGVLDAFDLSDAVPVTMRLGASAWNHDHHDWTRDDEHARCARLYVTPVLDGWTLVFGHPPDEAHPAETATDGGQRAAEYDFYSVVRVRCAALSDRFGAAHWYGTSCGDGWTAWCIAEHGRLLRCYDIEDPDDQTGPRHPAEEGYALPHENPFPHDAFDDIDFSDNEAFLARSGQLKQELNIPDTCYSTDIAARISVDPEALGPRTRVEGHGVLALTACGRRHGHPRGALQI